MISSLLTKSRLTSSPPLSQADRSRTRALLQRQHSSVSQSSRRGPRIHVEPIRSLTACRPLPLRRVASACLLPYLLCSVKGKCDGAETVPDRVELGHLTSSRCVRILHHRPRNASHWHGKRCMSSMRMRLLLLAWARHRRSDDEQRAILCPWRRYAGVCARVDGLRGLYGRRYRRDPAQRADLAKTRTRHHRCFLRA